MKELLSASAVGFAAYACFVRNKRPQSSPEDSLYVPPICSLCHNSENKMNNLNTKIYKIHTIYKYALGLNFQPLNCFIIIYWVMLTSPVPKYFYWYYESRQDMNNRNFAPVYKKKTLIKQCSLPRVSWLVAVQRFSRHLMISEGKWIM